jgi:hypothetical protein
VVTFPRVFKVRNLRILKGVYKVAANARGIFNVFDDGGYRTLLLVTMFGLTKPLGRLGNDAQTADGRHIELKTINLITTSGTLRTTYPGVTTEHSLTPENIARYRGAALWLIGVFRSNEPLEVWEIPSGKLEPYYQMWERKIAAKGVSGGERAHINNPKIPFGFVAAHGFRHPVVKNDHVARPKPGSYRALASVGPFSEDGE